MLLLVFWLDLHPPLHLSPSFDSFLPSTAWPGTALVLHPRIVSVTVLGLEVEWPLLLEQVPSNGIADVVASHDVVVHVLLTLCLIKSTKVNLANKLETNRAFLRRVIFIDAHDDIAKGSGPGNKAQKSGVRCKQTACNSHTYLMGKVRQEGVVQRTPA